MVCGSGKDLKLTKYTAFNSLIVDKTFSKIQYSGIKLEIWFAVYPKKVY